MLVKVCSAMTSACSSFSTNTFFHRYVHPSTHTLKRDIDICNCIKQGNMHTLTLYVVIVEGIQLKKLTAAAFDLYCSWCALWIKTFMGRKGMYIYIQTIWLSCHIEIFPTFGNKQRKGTDSYLGWYHSVSGQCVKDWIDTILCKAELLLYTVGAALHNVVYTLYHTWHICRFCNWMKLCNVVQI